MLMGRLKHTAKKRRLVKVGKRMVAPIWVSVRMFGMKRAPGRRLRSKIHKWRTDHKIQA